jgi:hypothetical protein
MALYESADGQFVGFKYLTRQGGFKFSDKKSQCEIYYDAGYKIFRNNGGHDMHKSFLKIEQSLGSNFKAVMVSKERRGRL